MIPIAGFPMLPNCCKQQRMPFPVFLRKSEMAFFAVYSSLEDCRGDHRVPGPSEEPQQLLGKFLKTGGGVIKAIALPHHPVGNGCHKALTTATSKSPKHLRPSRKATKHSKAI